jgi:hypothetical protein
VPGTIADQWEPADLGVGTLGKASRFSAGTSGAGAGTFGEAERDPEATEVKLVQEGSLQKVNRD